MMNFRDLRQQQQHIETDIFQHDDSLKTYHNSSGSDSSEGLSTDRQFGLDDTLSDIELYHIYYKPTWRYDVILSDFKFKKECNCDS